MKVTVGDASQEFSYQTGLNGQGRAQMNYIGQTLDFSVDGASETELTFASLNAAGSVWGAVIGNVAVVLLGTQAPPTSAPPTYPPLTYAPLTEAPPTNPPRTNAPPTPAPCTEFIASGCSCQDAPGCCAEGTRCFTLNALGTYAQCREECDPVKDGFPCVDVMAPCSRVIAKGSSCIRAPGCCEEGTQCCTMDLLGTIAQCLPSCSPTDECWTCNILTPATRSA
ncbi:hypothetical protein DIPPA_64584 [Diplonema papillatum]|nr:hypothetical protein DIPPA_64584 [Diplonema papillatum]